MTRLLKGKPAADALTEQLTAQAAALRAQGIVPKLAILRVGQREDDLAYERNALKRCEAIGIETQVVTLPADCTQADLLGAIEAVNDDPATHGCLMMRPLPAPLNEPAACEALDPRKDVDGITKENLFGVLAGHDASLAPCTADACLRLLDFYGIPLEGAKATVLGRSLVIGKPVAALLQARHATVTMAHSRTRDLAAACRGADIIVAAAGSAALVGADCLTSGQVVVDVGMNWDEAAQRFVGDVDPAAADGVVEALTPVPGGVGALTTTVLAAHVIEQAQRAQAGSQS